MNAKRAILAIVITAVTFVIIYSITGYTYTADYIYPGPAMENRLGPGNKTVGSFDKPQGSICLAVPSEYYETGWPFVYEKGTRPCGQTQRNHTAGWLNVVIAAVLSLIIGGAYLLFLKKAHKASQLSKR